MFLVCLGGIKILQYAVFRSEGVTFNIITNTEAPLSVKLEWTCCTEVL